MKSKTFSTYSWSVLLVFISTVNTYAQEATSVSVSTEESAMDWVFNNMFLLIGGIVFFSACLTIFRVFDRMVKVEQMHVLAEKGLLTVDATTQVEKESWWKRFKKKAWNIVPVEKQKDIILEHPHDGIYELDNNLPPWWLALFYGSIAFAVFYIGYTHFSEYGKTQVEQYAIDVKKAEAEIEYYLANQANKVDETNVEALTDETKLASGAKIFKDNCIACHGALGEGVVGPNLTDEYWLYGGDIKDVFKTIKYGALRGMKAWKEDLTASQIHEVSSYIMTLKGTNPPNALAPEGDEFISQK